MTVSVADIRLLTPRSLREALLTLDTEGPSTHMAVRTALDLSPNRPVVRNIQRPDDAPTINAHSLYKNPIRVKPDYARAPPGWNPRRKRSRVAMQLEKSSDFDRLLF